MGVYWVVCITFYTALSSGHVLDLQCKHPKPCGAHTLRETEKIKQTWVSSVYMFVCFLPIMLQILIKNPLHYGVNKGGGGADRELEMDLSGS